MADATVTINGSTYGVAIPKFLSDILEPVGTFAGKIEASAESVAKSAGLLSPLSTGGVNVNLPVTVEQPTVNLSASEILKKIAPWLVIGGIVLVVIIYAVKRG